MTRKKVSAEIHEYLRTIGKRGGKRGGPARRRALTPERRQEIARAAAKARWRERKSAE